MKLPIRKTKEKEVQIRLGLAHVGMSKEDMMKILDQIEEEEQP